MTFGNLDQSYGFCAAKPQPRDAGTYIVPIDKSFGFEALTHRLPYNSTKYFRIQGAYPESCTQFGYRQASSDQVIRSTSIMRPK